MVAFSLRTWRRNNVACDELLFLEENNDPNNNNDDDDNDFCVREEDRGNDDGGASYYDAVSTATTTTSDGSAIGHGRSCAVATGDDINFNNKNNNSDSNNEILQLLSPQEELRGTEAATSTSTSTTTTSAAPDTAKDEEEQRQHRRRQLQQRRRRRRLGSTCDTTMPPQRTASCYSADTVTTACSSTTTAGSSTGTGTSASSSSCSSSSSTTTQDDNYNSWDEYEYECNNDYKYNNNNNNNNDDEDEDEQRGLGGRRFRNGTIWNNGSGEDGENEDNEGENNSDNNDDEMKPLTTAPTEWRELEDPSSRRLRLQLPPRSFLPNRSLLRSREDLQSVATVTSSDDGTASNSTDAVAMAGRRRRRTIKSAVRRFRRSHPRVSQIGSIFFFRSEQRLESNNGGDRMDSMLGSSSEYAPSGPAVVGAALDLSMPILFNLHLFIEAYSRFGGNNAATTFLPLVFLSILIARTVFPPLARMRFWKATKRVCTAPFRTVRFTDAFLADIFTSLVRPIQDAVFALCYYAIGIRGLLLASDDSYGLDRTGEILESSWTLHRVVLPVCAALPLWFKFLQTLRQCRDCGYGKQQQRQRPLLHLGNAFKYASAAAIIAYGTVHPEHQSSSLWLGWFALAVLYQIGYDTVVDWELFVFVDNDNDTAAHQQRQQQDQQEVEELIDTARNVVLRPYLLLPRCRVQLRPDRLYKSRTLYWAAFTCNAVLRCTWMLCFLPDNYVPLLLSFVSPSKTTATAATTTAMSYCYGVALAAAEIVRRTIWGLLLVEVRTIKTKQAKTDNIAV